MLIRVRILTTLLALCIAAVAAARDTSGSISVEVTGPDKKPLADVKITITGIGKDHHGKTDRDGEFAVGRLQPGHYDVIAERDGYQPFRNRYVVREHGHTTARIQLQK